MWIVTFSPPPPPAMNSGAVEVRSPVNGEKNSETTFVFERGKRERVREMEGRRSSTPSL